ncbi:hypothetical protein [Actinoplanes couchii]|uniref:Uncharacterized protein n=1 Tax=Actinoplanes couchii TaxID=403638 RepID=A0ABQ3XTN6_9ACTN|nr:hypothetical protein [Actinoplanes couchii]MDR6318710.1 hypothetical protein [Actinoplanes couchii]GID61785.1 hypothetical protein Aco03nite_101890 [Actinoplanes couchii]
MNTDDDPGASTWPEVLAIAVVSLKILLLLQTLVVYRCRGSVGRPVSTAAASLAIVVCAILLASGHQAQRMRTSQNLPGEAAPVRDRPAAVGTYRL